MVNPTPGAPVRRHTTGLIALAVFIISLIVFVRITPSFMAKVWYPTGDEPYYLLVAHSLIHDHDIELTNNYDNQDYWHYYPGELYPRHEAKTVVPGLYSKHGLGVALLIVPAYAAADWKGTVYLFNVFGALLAANIYLLAYEVSRKHWVGLLLWLTFSFTNPIMSYTFLIFPSLLSGLFAIYAYRRIRLPDVVGPMAGNGVIRLLLISFCIGFLPWLNAQFLPVSASLFAYLVWRELRARRRASGGLSGLVPVAQAATQTVDVAAAGTSAPVTSAARPEVGQRTMVVRWLVLMVPLVISAVLFLAYYQWLYGVPIPNYGDHAGLGTPPEWVVGFFGTFLDQQWGLFIYAPVFVLAIVGFILMLKKKMREEFVWLAIIGIPYSIVIMTYKQWWGEWCPAARYWVVIVPLLVVPLAHILAAKIKPAFLALFLFFAAISWAIMAIFMYDPHLMYNQPVGVSHLFQWLTGDDVMQPFFPTYFRPEWINVWLTVLWSELVVFVVWLGWKQVKIVKAEE